MRRLSASPRSLARAIALSAALLGLCHAPFAAADEVSIQRAWQYAHVAGGVAGQKAEIVAHDDRTDTLWVAGVVGVDVLDRASGQLVAHIDVTHLGAVNSVAIHDGLAALAVENGLDRARPGVVVFFDTRSRRQLGAPVGVGALPDMLIFTPNGRQLLVANEGTPNAGAAEDPPGSVSIVDVRTRMVTTLAIDATIPGYDSLRLFPDSLTPYGPEPEYIAVDPDGRRAHVVLQEANGIAVLNLRERRFERIYSLGQKDFGLEGNEIDPDDRDGKVELRRVPAFGLYQPDAAVAYQHRGRTYLVMANEGDSREDEADEARGATYVADPELDRLTVSTVDSVAGGPVVAFGGRSFSIRDTRGRIVFDSGSQLDRAAIERGVYPVNESNGRDERSDNKGVEPEGVALLHIEGRVLAFIGLERASKAAYAVYDITDPREARFVDLIVSDGDVSPEGLVAFRAGHRYFLAAAHEVSDTTTLFEVSIDRRHGPRR